MEYESSSNPYMLYLIVSAVFALVVASVGYLLWTRSKTMPLVQGFTGDLKNNVPPEPFVPHLKEAFGGIARGAGVPDCMHVSSNAASLFDLITSKDVHGVEEGPADLREFVLLLSQLACFKKDLIGTAGVIESTRYQPFSTELNIESVSETTARCFAKTIPPRDLGLVFDKWKKRGHFLLTRLCTASDMNEVEVSTIESKFASLLAEVKSVADQKCFDGEAIINAVPQPRDTVAYSPPSLKDLGPYKGYY